MKQIKPNTLKGIRKADREREIELFGKQISTRPIRVHRSKKSYSRKTKHSSLKNGDFLCTPINSFIIYI